MLCCVFMYVCKSHWLVDEKKGFETSPLATGNDAMLQWEWEIPCKWRFCSRGFSIAMFDYRRVMGMLVFCYATTISPVALAQVLWSFKSDIWIREATCLARMSTVRQSQGNNTIVQPSEVNGRCCSPCLGICQQ